MRNNTAAVFAIGLIVIGALFLVGNLAKIDTWALCFPIGLIVLGVVLIARPMLAPADTHVDIRLLGDIKRRAGWLVQNEELWAFIGDVELDFTTANLPSGETRIRVIGLLGDLKIEAPVTTPLSISSSAFITDSKIYGEKREGFFSPIEWTAPSYAGAESRVAIESLRLIGSVRVR